MPSFRSVSMCVLGCLVLVTGCNLAGSWCTVEINPEDARFPIAAATFAEDGTYCVVHSPGGRTNTSSGTYRWTGAKLTLKSEGRPPQIYPGYLRLDGKLVLIRKIGNSKITAVLDKQEEEETKTPP